jgi:hypothetical protein
MENKTLDALFGPLNKKYCLWFYILSVLGFVFLVIALALTLFIGISKRKGIDFYIQMLIGSLAYVIFYFQNRLLYSMCISAI